MFATGQGHVQNVEYTHGYYGELNPIRAAFVLAYAGYQSPSFGNACELGFGQGVSISIHSAAQGTEWWGTDFNPQHAAQARSLSDSTSQANRLDEQGFAEFCSRPDLPEFDFIGLHGVWTWISTANQDVVIDFVRRKLRPGGVLYVSYNTFPGWADLAPIRQLFKEHVDRIGSPASPLFSRIDSSIAFLDQLAAVDPFYLKAAPRAAERMKPLSTQNKNYLAHEYLTDHWNVTYYADFAQRMDAAKVGFACSAHPLDGVDVINLTAEQQTLLGTLGDTNYRESIRDFCVNQQFRRDVWIKGASRLNAVERIRAVRTQRIVLTIPRAEVVLKVAGALGEASLHPEVYGPLLDFLADGAVHTVAEVEAAGVGAGITSQKALSAIPILVGMGAVQVAQDPERVAAAAQACVRLNAKIMAQADVRPEITYLASPVTGGGFVVQRFEQMFLAAYLAGEQTPQAWAEQAWGRIAGVGQSLIKDGQTLLTAEENLAELTRQAVVFGDLKLPILKSLGIA
ncbi:MAG: methyltransferase [Alphaproteobacteria bacterium PA2]|nr:MAG: methyltransferase [Alphaproteobacteria bacterium PA2]